MTRQEAEQSMEIGVDTALELIDGGMDLLATGEMGIGNTTPSSAIVSVLCGAEPGEVTGCGTGVSEPQRRHKADVVKGAVALHHPNPDDPLGVLAAVGGFEIGALAGLILGAAARRRPILVDGFVCTAAALVSQALCPAAADYTFAGHRSVERGHTAALRRLGKTPLLDLNLRLGEGTGAVLAMYILEAATRVLTQVATFEEAGIPRTSS